MLKTLLGREKFYCPFEGFFEEYWREVADLCLEAMRGSESADTLRLAVEALMLMTEMRKEELVYINYLRNQGAQYLIEHIMVVIDGEKGRGDEE
jgi:hypothetical protein